MKSLSRQRRRPSPAAIASTAAVVALLAAALPAVASASVVSIGVDPAAPKKNEPFNLVADGISLAPVTSPEGNVVEFGYAVGGGRCAPTAAEAFPPDAPGSDSVARPVADGDFRAEFHVPGVPNARVRICGYVYAANGPPLRSDEPLAYHGFVLVMGETCESATANFKRARKQLRKAKKQLAKAKRQLAIARQAGYRANLRRAKAKVKKARRKVKRSRKRVRAARRDRAALCMDMRVDY